jgi:hypothetical protein
MHTEKIFCINASVHKCLFQEIYQVISTRQALDARGYLSGPIRSQHCFPVFECGGVSMCVSEDPGVTG